MDHNLFPGVPLIESPVFSIDSLSANLSEQERRIALDLHEWGFAVLDFPDPAFPARTQRIKANLSRHFAVDFDDPGSDKTSGARRVQDAWKFDDDVRAIASNSAILQLLGKLYGRPAFPFQTLNFSVGTQQRAHSDSVHFSSLPERFMCGVWLALEDVSVDAGPLFYVPGSHRWPIVSNAMIGRRGYASDLKSAQDPYGPAWSALCAEHNARETQFLARAGQALIWCANLLHGGSPQINPKLTRWSQVTHYYFEDCIYYTPAFSDELLGRLALRQPMAIHDGFLRHSSYLGSSLEQSDKKSSDSRLCKWLKRCKNIRRGTV